MFQFLKNFAPVYQICLRQFHLLTKTLNTLLQITARMLDQFPSIRNRPKQLHQKQGTSPNKQNIDHKNHNCSLVQAQKATSSSQVRLKDFEILKESALSALIEKQEIIQLLTTCNHEELLQEIQQLSLKVKELQFKNTELREALQEAVVTLHEERHEWNQEHFKLVEEIEYLKDALVGVEASAEQTLRKNGQLIVENEQILREMNKLQFAFKSAQGQLLLLDEKQIDQNHCFSRKKSSTNSHECAQSVRLQIGNSYSYQKVIFEDFPEKDIQYKDQGQNGDHLSNIQEVLAYETEDWLAQPSLANSIPENHCLGQSIKAINLIDGYSVNSKNNGLSDSESQFTYKYFRYTNQHHLAALEKTLQDSCQDIPEVPEEQLLASEHQIEKKVENDGSQSQWWERIAYLAAGIFAGAYFVRKWKK